MIKIIVISTCIVVLSLSKLSAQDYFIEKSKKAHYLTGEKIKKSSIIQPYSTVIIKDKGELTINYLDRWDFTLYEGYYNLDSAIEANEIKYHDHDSLLTVLEDLGIRNCDFIYEYNCEPIPGDWGTSFTGMIDDGVGVKLNVVNDTITISWEDPEINDEEFFVVTRALFDGRLLGIHPTSEQRIHLDFSNYDTEQKIILYKIISNICRESDEKAFVRED